MRLFSELIENLIIILEGSHRFALKQSRDDDLNSQQIVIHDTARELNRTLVYGILSAIKDARNSPLGAKRDLVSSCGLAIQMFQAIDHPLNVNELSSYVRDLDFIIQDARELKDYLKRIDISTENVERLTLTGESNHRSRSIELLVNFMANLLPTQHRIRYAEEIKAELYDLAQAKATTTVQVVYALQQLGRIWQLREALLTPDRPRFHRLRRVACWVLSSDCRTWGLLGPLLTFGVVNIHLSQGWGSALFTLPGIVGFYAGVEWLRKRWNVEVKGADKAAGDLSNE